MRTILNVLLLLSLSATPAMAAGDLIVKGDLGVGTTTPDAKLDVRGGVKIGGADALCSAATEGMVRYNSTEKRAEFCDGSGWMTVTNGAPVDITGRTTDYALKVGETAYLTYTNATSVPLMVATQEGLYEIDILGDATLTPVGVTGCVLTPNAGGLAGNAISCQGPYTDSLTTAATGSIAPLAYRWLNAGFNICSYVIIQGTVKVNTSTKSKSVIATSQGLTNTVNHIQSQLIHGYWNDKTTPWNSLGTLIFGQAQSGKIIVRRVA